MPDIAIRESCADDVGFLDRLYPAAFPDEKLLPLVHALLAGEPEPLSLLAFTGGKPAGHVLFTLCGITRTPARAALLGPLAVAPDRQRQSIGSALIRDGLERLAQAGVKYVCVLGDPAYYGRHGFEPEPAIAPPYPLPEDWRAAWQSLSLNSAPKPPTETLIVPVVWMQPALWRP